MSPGGYSDIGGGPYQRRVDSTNLHGNQTIKPYSSHNEAQYTSPSNHHGASGSQSPTSGFQPWTQDTRGMSRRQAGDPKDLACNLRDSLAFNEAYENKPDELRNVAIGPTSPAEGGYQGAFDRQATDLEYDDTHPDNPDVQRYCPSGSASQWKIEPPEGTVPLAAGGKKQKNEINIGAYFMLIFLVVSTVVYIAVVLAMFCLLLNWRVRDEQTGRDKLGGCLCWLGFAKGTGLELGTVDDI